MPKTTVLTIELKIFLFFRSLLDYRHQKTPPTNIEQTIEILQSIHFKLIKCIKLTNLIYSFQVMLCIAGCYLYTFFTFFSTYKAFINDVQSLKMPTIASLYWCCYYNMIEISMILVCSATDMKNTETSKLIYKLMNCEICEPIVLQAFGSQVKGESAKSSCGLFNFDLQLLVMVRILMKLIVLCDLKLLLFL